MCLCCIDLFKVTSNKSDDRIQISIECEININHLLSLLSQSVYFLVNEGDDVRNKI